MAMGYPDWAGRSCNKKPATSAAITCCSDMSISNRRYLQGRLVELEYLARYAHPEARPSIMRTMRRIMELQEVITRAQERAEIAEIRLAHAEEIVRRLDRRD